MIDFSKILPLFSILILSGYFFLKKKNFSDPLSFHGFNRFSTAELIVICSSVTAILYFLFNKYSTFFWSFHQKIPSTDVMPFWRDSINQYDGIEGYVLYILMFLNIIFAFVFIHIISYLKNNFQRTILFSVLILITSFLYLSVGFNPPLNEPSEKINIAVGVPLVTSLILFISLWIYGKSSQTFNFIFIICLIPVCFVAISPISIWDYSLILSPSLRMLNGARLSDIYCPYDLFLSFIGVLWMKLKFDINYLQILAQASFFIFFISTFFFFKKLFINKTLSVFLLLLYVIIKYYVICHDPSILLAVTPLRLDLWIIILVLLFWKGVYHWAVGCALGLLILIHRNFGIIYLFSYIELCAILFFIDIWGIFLIKKNVLLSINETIKKHFFSNIINILIILGFASYTAYLLNGLSPKSALLFQKTGIGMLPISINSFYWFFPIISSMSACLLFKQKNKLSKQYFSSSLFIILLAIGNSLYFFGRSHENNIINISGILLLNLFLLFDLPVQNEKKYAFMFGWGIKFNLIFGIKTFLLPFILLLLSSSYYSDRIIWRIKDQAHNIKQWTIIPHFSGVPAEKDFFAIKKISNNSSLVYFLDYQNDFVYYYYGNYAPVGYFNPCSSWLLKKDFIIFINNLLANGYYVVTTNSEDISELLPYLDFNKKQEDGVYTSYKKDKIPAFELIH
ncbi:MAG: hypothetical protein HY841_13955 [Bacteroidetes bacterium]|nr:hypothetical protein [Bacteroidota bacterium]